ncbi:MAG: SusC/RagA family TonB-linked outer membrane protein, partial [Bacteroidota bacterium]
LRISYIGYKTQIVPVTDQTFYTIYLEEEFNSLDEVVITSSYGTKKLKQEVVASISTVKPEAIIKEQPAVSFEELLEGQVAGLNVEINPELGEAVAIDIRGQGSLTPLNSNVVGTSTQPLIIIDGIIMTEETGIDGSNFFDVGTGNLSENLLNPLAKIGIEDIETINVLKDAAAVGLYGADAANGVILITTKKGRAGDLRFNFSAQAGISNAFNGFKYLNGEQYQEVVNQYNLNSGFPDNVQEWNGVNTDWFDLLNQNGSFQRYNVGLTGGTGNFMYRANIGYQKNNESQISNDYSKWNAAIALDYQYKKWNVALRVSPSFVEKNNPNTLYNFALPPTLAPFDEDGNFTPFASFGNPLAVAAQNRANAETFGLLTSLKVDYDITENLKASTLFGMDFSDKDEDRYFNGLNGSGQFNDGDVGRRVIRERNTQRWNWNATLLYNKTFNKKHNFDAIGGIELRSENVALTFNRGDGFVNFETPQPISAANEQDFREDSSETNGVSFYSQANYNFDKRYFVLVNFRVDQSSAFGGDNDTAYNAGLGGGWNISNESFFEDVNGIDFLRLRTSFGTTGNSRIGSYRALGLYTTLDNGYNANPYANLTSLPNPNLGWERNEKFNIGLDVNFLDKFRFTTDYFQDVIKDMIVSRDVIPEVGLNSVQINGAEMKNWGIEMSLQANWIQNDNFRWNTTINYTRIRNEVTNLTGLGSQFSSAEVARAQRIGFATSTLWGFDFVGIDPATGTELYNVGGEIYDAAYVADNFDATDWQPIGNTQPDFYGGIINNFSYKNFNLSIAMSYTYGADILLGRELLDNYNVLTNRNISVNIFDDAWQQQGDIANYQAITRDRRIISNSTKYVFDTSHIRLKAVNLSYNLPVQKLNIPLKNLSVFVNGSNLW